MLAPCSLAYVCGETQQLFQYHFKRQNLQKAGSVSRNNNIYIVWYHGNDENITVQSLVRLDLALSSAWVYNIKCYIKITFDDKISIGLY